MIIKLDDNEIREILAEKMAEKICYNSTVDPKNCWFEVKASEINGEEVQDIYDVHFCYNTES